MEHYDEEEWDALLERYSGIVNLYHVRGKAAYEAALATLAEEVGTEVVAKLSQEYEDRAVSYYEAREEARYYGA